MTATAQRIHPSALAFVEVASAILELPQPEWLLELRRNAFAEFALKGIPTTKHEEWRFTPLSGLGYFRPSTLDPRPSIQHGDLPKGVEVLSLADAIAADHPLLHGNLGIWAKPEITPFAALNAALFTDGVLIVIPDNVTVDAPIRIAYKAEEAGALYSPRTLVIAGRNSSATVVESFTGTAGMEYFTNACCELVLDENARVEHIRMQEESTAAWHIGLTWAQQQRDSHYRSFSLALGGKLARHNLHARLDGENVETLMYGLYLPSGDQLIDNHTVMEHLQPNCRSWEVYKGVLADRARAVFNGKVWVDSKAQKTDAKQTNRNLLLSDTAKVDTKPQLEIFADDVKCTHGATVGKLDPQQRFYLQTRGIGGKTAQSLLLWAFAGEVLVNVMSPSIRAQIEADVRARLFSMIPTLERRERGEKGERGEMFTRRRGDAE